MLDWDDLRFFLAVARHRTLALAAKHLHVTQSTVSRRLAALQEGMGVRLLQRTAEGVVRSQVTRNAGLVLSGRMMAPSRFQRKRCGVAVLPGRVLGVVGLLEAGSFELTLCLTLTMTRGLGIAG